MSQGSKTTTIATKNVAEHQETTIWSKLEVEKLRQLEIRHRRALTLGPSKSFDDLPREAHGLASRSSQSKPASPSSSQRSEPRTTLRHEPAYATGPPAPSSSARVREINVLLDAIPSIQERGKENPHSPKKRVRTVKTSHNRQPNFNSKHTDRISVDWPSQEANSDVEENERRKEVTHIAGQKKLDTSKKKQVELETPRREIRTVDPALSTQSAPSLLHDGVNPGVPVSHTTSKTNSKQFKASTKPKSDPILGVEPPAVSRNGVEKRRKQRKPSHSRTDATGLVREGADVTLPLVPILAKQTSSAHSEDENLYGQMKTSIPASDSHQRNSRESLESRSTFSSADSRPLGVNGLSSSQAEQSNPLLRHEKELHSHSSDDNLEERLQQENSHIDCHEVPTRFERPTSYNASKKEGSVVSNQSASTHQSRLKYGASRIIDEENIAETEGWVYAMSLCMFVFAAFGISVVVLFVFGAAGSQVTKMERLQSQLKYLSNNPEPFEENLSPQFLAVNWLLNEDKAKIDMEDRTRREARYALAVLYYTTRNSDSDWKDKLNFLAERHECKWNDGQGLGVLCSEDETLVELRIVNNNMRGNLPAELSALSSLRVIDLSSNHLWGTIPNVFNAKLEEFIIRDNLVEGVIPSYISNATSLEILDVASNTLTSTLPPALGEMTMLQILHLGSNALSGQIQSELNTLKDLRDLDLSDNSFTGTMDFSENFPLLERLEVSTNFFTGTLTANLGQYVQELSFANNGMVGTLPSTLGELTNLRRMDASRNSISGTFPWSFFLYDNELVELVMTSNLLSGSMPADVARFENLAVLDLRQNKMTGSLPHQVGSMTSLSNLDLSSNGFTGELPDDLGSMSSLLSLRLAGNSFSSTIPPSIGDLEELEELILSSNLLHGEVPAEMGNLAAVDTIFLQNNDLTGSINFLCSLSTEPKIYADCGNPTEITCSCCTSCT